jgi:hypothetical protein
MGRLLIWKSEGVYIVHIKDQGGGKGTSKALVLATTSDVDTWTKSIHSAT